MDSNQLTIMISTAMLLQRRQLRLQCPDAIFFISILLAPSTSTAATSGSLARTRCGTALTFRTGGSGCRLLLWRLALGVTQDDEVV